MKEITDADRINNGVEVLRDYFGNDSWVDRINLDILDLESPQNCVVGQLLEGEFLTDKMRKLLKTDLYIQWSDYGFDIPSDGYDIKDIFSIERRFKNLASLWKEKIVSLRMGQ